MSASAGFIPLFTTVTVSATIITLITENMASKTYAATTDDE